MGWIILGVVVLFVVFYLIATYNRLVSVRELVRNSMGNIATQIESRWDALKSIIDATKQFSEHEAKLLTEVTSMRANINKTSSPSDVEKDNQLFDQALRRINVVAENYPQLRSSDLYNSAMASVDKYENNVRMSRMVYNDTVTKLNRAVQQFPSNLVAGMFGFNQEQYFQNDASKADMPSWN